MLVFALFALFAFVANAQSCDFDYDDLVDCQNSVYDCMNDGNDDDWCDCYDDDECDGFGPSDELCDMDEDDIARHYSACANDYDDCIDDSDADSDEYEQCICDLYDCYYNSAAGVQAFVGVVAVALFALIH
jgi:hypothetical protein